MHAPKKLYIIDGNISCGKTTGIENLRQMGYSVFEEPLEVWQKEYIFDGHNILDLFYSDMKKWGFKFELISLMTRYKQLKSAYEALGCVTKITEVSKQNIVFIERSLLTDRHIFALNLYHEGVFDELEWKIYCEWHDLFMSMVDQLTSSYNVETEYIYIQTPPEECFARKIGRGRAEETDVTPKYFRDLHNKYEDWLSPGYITNAGKSSKVHIIRGDGTREEVLNELFSHIFTS